MTIENRLGGGTRVRVQMPSLLEPDGDHEAAVDQPATVA